MDSFFGIGFPELVLILLLAGLVLGPQRIREVSRTLGKWIAQLQKMTREFSRQINSELDQMDRAEIKGALDDVRALQKQMNDLKQQVKQASTNFVSESKQGVAPAGDNHTILPPNGSRLPKVVKVDDDPEV